MRPLPRCTGFWFLAGVILAVVLAGCAGASGGTIPAGFLLVAGFVLSTFGFWGTSHAGREVVCDGTVETACENGVLVDACCPQGVICNFGLGLEICDDGSCVYLPAQCPGQVPTPTPTPAPSACAGDCDYGGSVTIEELIRGVSIAIGNSAVAACNAVDADSDGRVTISEVVQAVGNALAGCPPQCSGYWDQECLNGVVTDVCCPKGVICNFGRTLVICDDGSCVDFPDTCPDTCDGHWETACRDGVPVRACCPEGLACNFSRGLEICDDGSCVYFPETCT
jgi:hypothetical protein